MLHSTSEPSPAPFSSSPPVPKASKGSTLIFGATGGIGSQALVRLLDLGYPVTAFVRSSSRVPEAHRNHPNLYLVVDERGHLALGEEEFKELIKGHETVISCLGHNLTFKGMFGSPRRLCRDTVKRIFSSVDSSASLRLIVINTEGVDRPDGGDGRIRGCCERVLLGLLALCIPPHADNVDTISCLHSLAGVKPNVSYVAIRPSDLVDKEMSGYQCYEKLQNGIFNAGRTSRANVGDFIARLTTEEELWRKWRNSFPHILDVD